MQVKIWKASENRKRSPFLAGPIHISCRGGGVGVVPEKRGFSTTLLPPRQPLRPRLLLLIPTLPEDTGSGPPLLISLFPTSKMLRVMSSHRDGGSPCAPGEPPLQRNPWPPKALGLTDLPPLRLSHWLGSCLLEISGPPTPLSPLPHPLGSSPTPPPFWPCRTSLQSQIS